MFKKNIKLFISTLFLVLVLCSPFFVFSANGAGTALNKLQNVGTQSGYSAADETTLATTLGIIVRFFFDKCPIMYGNSFNYTG